jgi:hypothetical protein
VVAGPDEELDLSVGFEHGQLDVVQLRIPFSRAAANTSLTDRRSRRSTSGNRSPPFRITTGIPWTSLKDGGVILANVMFGLATVQISQHAPTHPGLWIGELVATRWTDLDHPPSHAPAAPPPAVAVSGPTCPNRSRTCARLAVRVGFQNPGRGV